MALKHLRTILVFFILIGADPEELLEEWGNFKFLWQRSLSHLNVDETWAALIVRYSDVYPNLVHMVYVMLLVPGK